ncbi:MULTISPECIES: LysR substrate-binding domain-containing protein [Rhizobium/Agrobacterium group]|uniref:LysR substrate-binding domain-containing protein n=1 Tax=Rhizobium/Agrobacterium group TaxID=227290 RepID=UPI000B406CC2|nr:MULTISPECIES: LysR substrate-binding domain-containing protein [Rhizobium/Agrobacterium group]MCF1483292.1 LysR family transcriptional regulator [Allorhizobium ampelinum]NSZ41475.1 LysR family transcriptional regulator [Agrobacterium vitis]NTA25158.1 LysR family transcriptional regulator [Allorhizobium ampelinum]OVE98006.1 LysR family transcriptional regulator [Allorhizobium ampelinum]
MSKLNLVHLNGLRAVEAVGRLGSLQAAASELGVSIGAISQQVIKAEQQLQLQLFERTSRGMVPTDVAEPVLDRLSAGFRHLSGAVALALKSDDTVLTISVAPVFAARWLVHRIGAFSERFPTIRLRMEASDRLIDPSSSDVDLCIRVGRGDWPGVRTELLLEQKVFPVCTPAMAKRLQSPADLLDVPIVEDGRAMFSWDVWLAAAGLPGRSVCTRHVFSEASLCLDAALAGQGVLLAWQTIASQQLQQGQLVAPFGPAVPTGLAHYFVSPEGARRNDKVDAFKRWLRGELHEDMTRLAKAIPFLGDPFLEGPFLKGPFLKGECG